MPNLCSVCEHPERARIELALVRKVPYRSLEAQFGVSKDSLHRHRKNHLPGQLRKVLAVALPASDV